MKASFVSPQKHIVILTTERQLFMLLACIRNVYTFTEVNFLGMKAPMSDLVRRILADPKKAKAFTAAVLRANRSDQPVTIINEGKKYKFTRVTALVK